MKLRLILSLFFLSLVPALAESGPHRIAVIDVNQVLEESTAGKAIFGRLQAAQGERAAKADKMEAELRKLQDEYGTHQLSWSAAQIAERVRVLKEKQAALDSYLKEVRQELGAMRDREMQGLEEKIGPVIEAVAAEKNLDAVFNKSESGLIFASDRIDITSDVVTRFNAGK